MNKDIKYNGYSAQPSDYECPDGDLAMSLNLINEDGFIKSIPGAKSVLSIGSAQEVLLIHSVPGQENLIILTGNRNGSFGLSWLKYGSATTSTENAKAIEIKSLFNTLLDISIVGNTLAVATSKGVYYILWKDDDYKYLGNKPPFLPISFGAYKAGTLQNGSSTTYTNVPNWTYIHYSGRYSGSQKPHAAMQDEDEIFWENVSTQALGLLLSEVSERVTSNGYVYQPFYIRYAFKLYDGSYSWHSAPILMLVSTHRPIISISCSDAGDNSMQIACTLAVPYFGIAYRIFGSLDLLKEWSDIISGVDVFMSSPLYTYNQDKAIGLPMQRRYIYDGIYQGGFRGRPKSTETIAESSTSESNKVFTGHYGEAINGAYIDHFITTPQNEMTDLVCSLSKNDDFNDNVQHSFLFYKASSFNLDDLSEMTQMEYLPLLKADLSNINTLETLPDEYNSHATVLAGALHTYNQRLLMSDISIEPPTPLPMCSLAQAATKTSEVESITPSNGLERIRVFTRINGKKCVSEYTQPLPQKTTDPDLFPFKDSFPRFLYHPDASAYKMEISTPDGQFYALPLTQHPHLNGAYWFGGMGGDPTGIEKSKEPEAASSVIVSNKVYISEVNNPFIFPAQNIITIDCGRIFRLCSAAKALSQGQFGQFPLYAFTDDGVWAMEISSTGTISAKQPITRDVCINPSAITQIDSAVLFPTDRGIMLISGSQTQCITDVVNNDTPFNIQLLPHMKALHTKLYSSEDNCFHIKSFTDYLAACDIIYDYPHQRIIIFNNKVSYAYVYSLKTMLWGLMHSNIVYKINSYPEALAVDNNNNIVNFSLTDDTPLPGLLVTRPLKLDAPDILKTVDTVIQRGNFRKGHVQSVLFGSRDLQNWHLVWSSKDHYLRGFRGSPYKYFRIALLCNLSPDESIFGASLQFTPRHTNQPR